jgi:hypothetical protein
MVRFTLRPLYPNKRGLLNTRLIGYQNRPQHYRANSLTLPDIDSQLSSSCQSGTYSVISNHWQRKIVVSRGAQVTGVRWPQWLHFIWWRLILVGPQYGISFMPGFWRLEFWDGSRIFWKICAPLTSCITLCCFDAAQQRQASPPEKYKIGNISEWNFRHCSSEGGKTKEPTLLYSGGRDRFYIWI